MKPNKNSKLTYSLLQKQSYAELFSPQSKSSLSRLYRDQPRIALGLAEMWGAFFLCDFLLLLFSLVDKEKQYVFETIISYT
jgi:hypothetical protein